MKNEVYHAIHHISYRDGSEQGEHYLCYSKDLELIKKIFDKKIKKNVVQDISLGEMEYDIVENTEKSFIYENDSWRYEYSISENVKLNIIEESDLSDEDFMDTHIFFNRND